ncbi:MAG: S4 domain-containing protein, partial [Candidatus Aminicenantaceae bacterium]
NKEVPSKIEEKEVTTSHIPLIDFLVNQNIFPSRAEAKRTIRQGGIYLDGERIKDIAFIIDFKEKSEFILKIGKKKFYKILKHK